MNKTLVPRLFLLFFITLFPLASFASQNITQDLAKADRLFGQGKYAEALTAYRSALGPQLAPAQAGDLHSRIADCHFKLENYGQALAEYRLALQQQKPTNQPSTQYWIGFCSFVLGRDEDAVAELLKVPARYPASRMLVQTSYYWAGRASERLGRKEQAAEYYRLAGGSGKSSQDRFALKRAEAVKKGARVQ
jgi:tetratricopeptide (TPR) repeat protein